MGKAHVLYEITNLTSPLSTMTLLRFVARRDYRYDRRWYAVVAKCRTSPPSMFYRLGQDVCIVTL